VYSGRKITASLGNVTVRGERRWKGQGGARWPTVCLSMYSITENIYYSQLSSVTLLLQPERNFSHRIIQVKDWVLSPYMLSSCCLLLPPTCLLVTVNEARSYFAFTIADPKNTELWQLIRRAGNCHELFHKDKPNNRRLAASMVTLRNLLTFCAQRFPNTANRYSLQRVRIG
jgi:hypothetical protein